VPLNVLALFGGPLVLVSTQAVAAGELLWPSCCRCRAAEQTLGVAGEGEIARVADRISCPVALRDTGEDAPGCGRLSAASPLLA
jgi:hypothetical protein